mgnify:CR=1 FL=1
MFYAVLTKYFGLIMTKLISFGMKQLPAKSTLFDTNGKRSYRVFEQLYKGLYSYYRTSLVGNWLDIVGAVDYSRVEVSDSSTVTLFKEILKGDGRNPLYRKKKGGAKIFANMNLAKGIPNFICIRSAATNENMFLKVMNLPGHGITVFHKG